MAIEILLCAFMSLLPLYILLICYAHRLVASRIIVFTLKCSAE